MTGAIVFLVGLILCAPAGLVTTRGFNAQDPLTVIVLFFSFWGGLAAMVVGSSMILWATTMGKLC